MAQKHVVAYFMHEHEEAEARQRIAGTSTESYVIGMIDEADIPALQARGVVVREVPPPREAKTPGRVAPQRMKMRTRMRMRGGAAAAPPMAVAPAPAAAGEMHYLVSLVGPLLEQHRAALAAAGVTFGEHVPPGAYTARLSLAQAQQLGQLPFVRDVRLYDEDDTGPLAAPAALAPPTSHTGVQMQTWDIRLHDEVDLPKVLAWMDAQRVPVAGSSRRKLRVYVLEDSPVLDQIAQLDAVAALEQYVAPELHNDVARQLLGVDAVVGGPGAGLGLTGAGQIVGVADTGIDDRHPDLANRLAGVVALGRPGDHSDPHGHGTHVAGSIAGDGTASGGAVRGVAPGAQVFFQSLLDANGKLGGLPLDLADLFEEAYQNGARVHNDSWGAATGSMYTINSTEVDEFVSRRRDMLIVISAGNEGDGAVLRNAQKGFVEWLSIGSPASAKNALVVGASRSSRTQGGYATLTYNDVWPSNFPDAPIAGEKVSGNRDGLAAFSSRGPCDDDRIKPDVVAPGTDILSTKSARAPLRNFWGAHANAKYAFMGGTSMASPLVAGCAALVREFFIQTGRPNPSAALLKATLINGARWLGGPDAVADHPKRPNYHQGFGCVDLRNTVPHGGNPALRLEVLDTWQTPALQFVRTGQRFRFAFQHGGTLPLRICLVWTDLPARGTQNSLSFMLEHQGGQKRVANADLFGAITTPDPDNNVQILQVDPAPPGQYLVQVFARNLLQPPQDFALVVTGDLAGPLTRI